MVLEELTTRHINLPFLGTVGLPLAVAGGLALYFFVFKRKGKITSVTTRYRR